MVIFPFGIPRNFDSPQEEWKLKFMNLIEEVGFQSVKMYTDKHKSWAFKCKYLQHMTF